MTTGDPVLDFAISLRDPLLTVMMSAASAASSPQALVALIPVIYWVLSRRVGLMLLVTVGASSATAVVVKDVVAAPRPPNVGEGAWIGSPLTTYAFPSGHATSTAAATATPVALRPSVRAAAAAASITALVSFSRLYLGVHYFADVAAGAVLGAAIATAVVLAAPRVAPALGRLPLAARTALGLVFLAPLAVNASALAILTTCPVAGALCGHVLAEAWGWKVETGRPGALPAYGILRVALGLPVLIGLGLGLGDPLSAGPLELSGRFLLLGAFVTLLGPRVFMAVERATPWTAGFSRRPSH